jgi:choline dehydrogenase-like flavoprotein
MFVDARQLPQDSVVEADICIFGAGAAGITLARALGGGNLHIAVFESGGFEFDIDTQNLYSGAVVGHAFTPIDRDRLRYLGGSTNHWQGSCRPFDAFDLEDWPFGLDVLDPYYRQAQKVCQLGPYSYDPTDWIDDASRPIHMSGDDKLKSGLFQYSPPTRFGTVYRDELATANNVTLYLNANLVGINTNESASNVTDVEIACLNGRRFRARAKHYVLATGGIENARLLLNANRVQQSGLGNAHDLVGRYFMDHVYVPSAATILADASRPEVRYYNQHVVRGQPIEGFFTASDDLRRSKQLPPFYIGFRVPTPAGNDLGQTKLPRPLRAMLSEGVSNSIEYYLSRSTSRLELPAKWLYEKMWRAQPGAFITCYGCGPNPDPLSRVTLADTVDALGLRQSVLDWRLPPDLEQNMRRAHELLAQVLGRTGLGRVHFESGAAIDNAHHHMGTTRMHDDPHYGVVNRDCQIHGIGNLFIAGSSVFPSFACDDPTMTIVTLALRLSDHLKSLPS